MRISDLIPQNERKPVSPETPVQTPATPPVAGNEVTREAAIEAAKGAKIASIFDSAGTPGAAGQTVQPLGTKAPIGSLMSAEILLNLWDSLIPGLMVVALYRMKVHVKKTELQLSEKEKGIINPIFQKCLDTINFNFENPWTALLVTVGVVYGSKVTEKGIVGWLDKKAADDANAASDKVLKEQISQGKEQAAKPDSQPSADFPEDVIKSCQKKRQVGRERAIAILFKMRKEGKPLIF